MLMSEAGFPHIAATVMPARKNGVAVLSRTPFSVSPPPSGEIYGRRGAHTLRLDRRMAHSNGPIRRNGHGHIRAAP
jgi:hypothetical protein